MVRDGKTTVIRNSPTPELADCSLSLLGKPGGFMITKRNDIYFPCHQYKFQKKFPLC